MAKKIVVVEDDDILAKALLEELQEAGYETRRASDGREGLALVLKEQPDLVLLDIVMPETGGLDMLGNLRKHEQGKQIPVIVLTNLPDNELVAQALELGAYTYLVKSHTSVEGAVEKVRGFFQE
jgi:DNA-binding response OmpR family regulator